MGATAIQKTYPVCEIAYQHNNEEDGDTLHDKPEIQGALSLTYIGMAGGCCVPFVPADVIPLEHAVLLAGVRDVLCLEYLRGMRIPSKVPDRCRP